MYTLNSYNAIKLFMWICAHSSDGTISLTSAKRKLLAEQLSISPNTITKCLVTLKRANLLSGEKGEFLIN